MAEADGLKGHGLSRVPMYAAQAKIGKVDGQATPVLTKKKPALIAVDAANGFAYPAIELAEAALPKSRAARASPPPRSTARIIAARRAIQWSDSPTPVSSR